MSAVLTRGSDSRAPLERVERGGLCPQARPGGRYRGEPECVGVDPTGAQAGGRLTLEQRLDSVWEGLHAGGAVDCPVCSAQLRPAPGARAVRCGGCGSAIA